MRPAGILDPEHDATLAAWAARHARTGIASAELDWPAPGDDADLLLSAAVYLVERPWEAAYLLVQVPGGWDVFCHGRQETVGSAPDLLGALHVIRPDPQDPRAAA